MCVVIVDRQLPAGLSCPVLVVIIWASHQRLGWVDNLSSEKSSASRKTFGWPSLRGGIGSTLAKEQVRRGK
jgi:hypothetical protein